MPLPTTLITGASGFVGDRLLGRLDPAEYPRLRLTSRTPSLRIQRLVREANVAWYAADLPHRPLPDKALDGVEVVVHLAAKTGKAQPADYFTVNVEGTRDLLEQCSRRGVRSVLFVSSIAARFRDVRRYYYAQSKRQAEGVVAGSGLQFTVVRPTLVVGRGGGAWAGLVRLARLPWTPIFGDGRTLIQPIHVDDLVDALLRIIIERRFDGATLDLGGPEPIALSDFLRLVRAGLGRPPARLVYLPIGPVQKALVVVEGWFGPVLPLTAGQLATFAADGTARPDPLPTSRMGIQEMIAAALHEESRLAWTDSPASAPSSAAT